MTDALQEVVHRRQGVEECVLSALCASVRGIADGPIARRARTEKGGAGGRKKLTEFNKFMQTEMARLKETEPDLQHRDR